MHESPRFFGRHVGMSAGEVYKKWVELGLIEYYHEGNGAGWKITECGKSLGGRLSGVTTKYTGGTPTFDYDTIKHLF